MACYIYGAGGYDPLLPKPGERDFVIAADGGYETLKGMGIHPHTVIGDFDSLGYVPTADEVIVLPKEKDVTDLWAGVEDGVKRRHNTFVLLGCTGGRPDHTFSNYQLLFHLAKENFWGYMMGDGYTVTVLSGGERLTLEGGGTLSLFAMGGVAEGVTAEGVYYPAKGLTLTPHYPLGVSNDRVADFATVGLEKGYLLVMWEGYTFPIDRKKG